MCPIKASELQTWGFYGKGMVGKSLKVRNKEQRRNLSHLMAHWKVSGETAIKFESQISVRAKK